MAEQEEGVATRWEISVFLKDKKGAKVCVKAIGDASVLDDSKTVVEALYADGYQPDGYVKAEAAKPAPAGSKTSPEKKPCPVHEGHSLYRKSNAKGTWYSHKNPDGDGYCNGREE